MRLLTTVTQLVLWSAAVSVAVLLWPDLPGWFVVRAHKVVAARGRRVSAVEQTRMLRVYRDRGWTA